MPKTKHLYPAERMVAYSDAVFSIAVTLLVIEIHLPESSAGLLDRLVSLWPNFLSFVISFLIITVVWFNHHEMFHHIRKVDQRLIVYNTLLMFNIILIPLASSILGESLLGESHDPLVACALYGAWISLGGIPFNLLWDYASRNPDLLEEGTDPRYVRRLKAYYMVGPFAYALAALSSLLSIWVALGFYVVLIFSYFLPPEWFKRAKSPAR
jgi:uncharacterized membrane protein